MARGPPYDPNHGVTFVVTVDWPAPLDIVADIVVVEGVPVGVQHPPLNWVRLAFAMQNQHQSNWCWCATTVSVANFYGDTLMQRSRQPIAPPGLNADEQYSAAALLDRLAGLARDRLAVDDHGSTNR